MHRAVRPATIADANEIARLHVAGWRAALGRALGAENVGDAPVKDGAHRWIQRLDSARETRCVYRVVLDGGRLEGFVAAGPHREGRDPWSAEVYALYVDPLSRSPGLGRLLWDTLPDALAAAGYRRVCTWVLDGDDVAGAFFRGAGLAPDGGRRSLAAGRLAQVQLASALPLLPFAGGFAQAIDDEDFRRAAVFLDPMVVYETGRAELVGVDQTIDAYGEAARQAARMFDELVNENEVDAMGGDRARVRYTDRLRHRGHAHAFRCQQVLTIPAGRGVVRIVHRELPGERARLQGFMRRAGVGRVR